MSGLIRRLERVEEQTGGALLPLLSQPPGLWPAVVWDAFVRNSDEACAAVRRLSDERLEELMRDVRGMIREAEAA